MEEDEVERLPLTKNRAPEEIDKKYIEILSCQISIFIEKGYKLVELHFK